MSSSGPASSGDQPAERDAVQAAPLQQCVLVKRTRVRVRNQETTCCPFTHSLVSILTLGVALSRFSLRYLLSRSLCVAGTADCMQIPPVEARPGVGLNVIYLEQILSKRSVPELVAGTGTIWILALETLLTGDKKLARGVQKGAGWKSLLPQKSGVLFQDGSLLLDDSLEYPYSLC